MDDAQTSCASQSPLEDDIDEAADLTLDEKAALWLYAFSLRPPFEQQLDARTHLAALG